MVRANCANRNAKIRAPSIPSAGPEIDVQCTLPGRGRRNGLRAGSWASRGRAGLGALRARISCAHPRDARLRRSLTRSERADRSRADTGEPQRRKGAADGASTTCLVKDHAQRFLSEDK
jgi:hypothetical protein